MSDLAEKQSILVVDDEETLRLVISSVLEDEGYEVTTAASAEEALEIYKSNSFKLVISDIVMPGMSGIELLKEIKDINPEAEVIIMTSQASMETAINAVSAGAYDYLMKPFEELDLIAKQAFEKISLLEEKKILVDDLQGKNIELTEAIGTLEELANRDGLTGLHNHRCFQETLVMEVTRSDRYKREFSLLFFDIDSFKLYNDTNGHPAGDELLRTLSKLIRDFLRKSDFFARYGGEEFTVILPETSKDHATVVAGSIREIIENHPFYAREKQPNGKLTVSIGIAAYPVDAKNGEELIEKADQALYKAKHTGRNKVCVYGQDV